MSPRQRDGEGYPAVSAFEPGRDGAEAAGYTR